MAIDDKFIEAFHAHQRRGDLFHPIGRDDNGVFQSSTLGALMEGVYDGEVTYAEIARHGTFGLGTFNALDGEMVAFDGRFFQIKVRWQGLPGRACLKDPFCHRDGF